MYVPHSDIDLKKIFKELSIKSLDELFSHIPKELILNDGLDLPDSISELEAIEYFEDISNKNKANLICFAGGGHYDVFLPHTVKTLTMRPEFMTSYTPYQAEISQGVLQALFEFQSLVCDLTEMELANASLYDGATSIAEAISVAINKTKRDNVVISEGLHPNNKKVINTLIDKNKFVEGKRIAIIQPNISQDDKIYKKDLFETISNLTELSRHENIDLTIWPESVLPILLEQNKETINLIVKNISTGSQLLVGNITYRDNSFRNSALLINNKSNIQNIYNKVHLVPFGEFIPFKNFLSNIPFIKVISGDIGFEKGQDIELVDTSVGKSRVAICYEIIFPEEINPYNKDLDLIINITNDAWFGQSSGPYQHLNIARIRAIEQGVPVLRSANTGISALIDPYGRVIEKIDLNKRGSIVSLLPKKIKKTIYSIIGDYLFFGVLILSLLILFISKRRN